MSIEIKHLTKQDLSEFTLLIRLFNTVFEEESKIAGETNLLDLLNNNTFIALVAIDKDEVVAGLTAYELPMYYSDGSEIFLYDLAVKPDYQRMGIGRGLIQQLKKYCTENGIKEFFVMAHEDDEHAVEFYHATGGKAEKVVNFLYQAGEK